MKFLRAIRFDQSDDQVFARSAIPDEWCISGGFEFADAAPEDLVGKTRQAFANGFLGIPSFGRTTFATVGEIDALAYEDVVRALARHFVDVYGAPGEAEARAAAEDEAAFVGELCAEVPVNTVFTVRRVMEDGEIREEFREIAAPGEPKHARIWDVVADEP